MATKTIYSARYRQLVQRLRDLREAKGVTQTALSKELGWPQQRLSAVEAGARRLDVMEFLHLTSRLGITPEDALGMAVQSYKTPASKEAAEGRKPRTK